MLSHNNMWKWEISGNIYHFKKNILNLMAAATLEKTLDWGNKRVESRKVKNFSGQTIFLILLLGHSSPKCPAAGPFGSQMFMDCC